MSVYTAQEYSDLKSAIIKLLSGTQAVQVSIGGKFIRYQDSQVEKAQALLNSMALDLGYATPRAFAKQKTRSTS